MNNAQIAALRDIKYPTVRPGWITCSFVREFTTGTLVGLTHEDQIGFCSEAAAAEWVSSINRKNAAGTVDYKIVPMEHAVSAAKKGDFVVVECLSRITTLSPRTAAPIYSVIRCGVVASADREGTAKTMRVNGTGKPIKFAEWSGFQGAHVVSASRMNVAEAVKACASRSFTSVDEVREAVRPFLLKESAA